MSEYRICVDTALSTEGNFPTPTSACYVVEIEGPYGPELVLVSARYTAPMHAMEAAEIAVDAYTELPDIREVPWPGMGSPFYHVTVRPANDRPRHRDDEDGGEDVELWARGVVRLQNDEWKATGQWEGYPNTDNPNFNLIQGCTINKP